MRLLKIIFLFCLPIYTSGQSTTDSLLNEFKQVHVNQKLIVLSKLSDEFNNQELGVLKKYSSKLISIAYESGDTLVLMTTWNLLRRKYYNLGLYKSAIKYSRNALYLAQQSHNEERIAYFNSYIGRAFRRMDYSDSALYHFEKSMLIYRKLNIPDRVSNVQNLLGLTYKDRGNYPISLKYFNQSLEYYKKTNNQSRISSVYNNIGIVYINLGVYDEALENLFNALKISEKAGNKIAVARRFHNIGLVYRHLNKYQESIYYLSKALNLKKENNSLPSLARTYSVLGDLYMNIGNYKTSLDYNYKGLEIRRNMQDDNSIGSSYLNIAEVHIQQSKFLSAKSFAEKAIKHFKSTNDSLSIAAANLVLSRIYKNLNNFQKAIELLNSSLSFSKPRNLLPSISNIYSELFNIYEKLGDYKKANEYLNLATQAEDKIFNESNNKKISEIASLYRVNKNESELINLKDSAVIQSLKFESQKQFNYLLLTLVLFTIILMFFLVFLNKNIKTSRSVISKQNIELDKVNSELKISNSTKDKFISIISHDLKNPIGNIINFANLLITDSQRLEEKEIKEIIDQISSSSEKTLDLFENLVYWALSQRNLIELTIRKNDISKIIQNNLAVLEGMIKNKHIHINNKLTDPVIASFDKNTISTVTLNLLSNAIKFTPESGSIKITKELIDDSLVVSVKDSGVGLSENDIELLFKPDSNNSEIGSSANKGTGLGLKICADFIEKNNGKIWVSSRLNEGSNFSFSLPVNKN